MSKSGRFLRQVVDRWPMSTITVRETLECGHKLIVYPPADQLTAKYRTCQECAKAIYVPEKKPVAPARIPSWRKTA